MSSNRFTFFLFLVIVLIAFALAAQGQQELRQFGIAEVFRSGDSIFIKKLTTRVINVSEGAITKMRTPPDTATLFLAPDGLVYEGVTVWKKVNVTVPPVPVIEKIDGEAATFSANWSNHGPTTAAGWHAGTIAFSNALGSTATYTFTGTKIELWAERLTSHGTGTVKIDTGAEVPVSFKTTPFGLPVKIYESATLPLGTHTIVLKCTLGYVLLDYFIVTK